MTQKRFSVTSTILGSGIYDYQAENELCESYDEDAYGEVCKLLNALYEENEQLRKENEKLESLWEDKCIKEYMKVVGENVLQEMHNEKYGDK